MAQAAQIEDFRPYRVIGKAAEREHWLDARSLGIGASEIAGVLGISAWVSPFSLYLQKTRQVEPPNLDDVERVQWGNILEEPIAREYGRRSGRVYEMHGKLLQSTEHPWALCTLDALTTDGAAASWPLEIKTASEFKASDWTDGAPEVYYAQIQQQMLVTGAKKATIACLLGGQQLVWCDVERDEMMIRRIVHHGERFWQRVLDRDMPEPDGSDASASALAKLYPADDGGTVVLDAGLMDLAGELDTLKAESKRIASEIKERENRIKQAIGEATRGVLPDGSAYSWKTQSRKETVVKASTFRVLRRHAAKER